jgi:hypothetical protein
VPFTPNPLSFADKKGTIPHFIFLFPAKKILLAARFPGWRANWSIAVVISGPADQHKRLWPKSEKMTIN